MSIKVRNAPHRATTGRRHAAPRADDPRVVRSRAAIAQAATALFLEKGYAGTTMEDIAQRAGITKRTLYNNYPDKDALFTQVVSDVMAYADEFVRGLRNDFAKVTTPETVAAAVRELARRLALGIIRLPVIALRRLIVSEGSAFPRLARQYYERAPGQVIGALATAFTRLARKGLLRPPTGRTAATQFAYLVAGEPLDRAMLTGEIPTQREVLTNARLGVETFLARYGTTTRS